GFGSIRGQVTTLPSSRCSCSALMGSNGCCSATLSPREVRPRAPCRTFLRSDKRVSVMRATGRQVKLPLYQIDAFTSRLFGGNPAAVVTLDQWLPDDV